MDLTDLIPSKAIVKYLALAFLALGLYGAGYYQGYSHEEAKLVQEAARFQKELDSVVAGYNQTIAADNLKSAKITSDLQAATIDLSTKLKDTQNELDKKTAELKGHAKVIVDPNTGIATGGLSLHGASCTGREPSTSVNIRSPSDPESASQPGSKAECRLDEQTANALISIAADGNKAITQLNSVIDLYNEVKAKGCQP